MKATFKLYLIEKHYSKSSVRSYELVIERFLRWLDTEQKPAHEVRYKDALSYVKHLRAKGLNSQTLTHYIGAIKLYYSYLIAENQTSRNPFARLDLKGSKPRKLKQTIGLEVLDYLLESYPRDTPSKRRDVLILGLMIHQGLSATDVKLLKTSDVDWLTGRLNVPRGLKTEGRSLAISPIQIFAFKDYIEMERSKIHPIAEQTEQLFFGSGGRLNLDNVLSNLTKTLKVLHPEFTTLQAVRNTRIMHWVKTEGLRKAQYKAGHRYISSTESYKPIEGDSLFKMVAELHPIR